MTDPVRLDRTTIRRLLRFVRRPRRALALALEHAPFGESQVREVVALFRRSLDTSRRTAAERRKLAAAIARIGRLRAIDKAATLRDLEAEPEFARLFAPDSPPQVRRLATALTAMPVSRTGSRFPGHPKPMFEEEPFLREGVSHAPNGATWFLRAAAHRVSAQELRAVSANREPLLEAWRGKVTTSHRVGAAGRSVLVPVAPFLPGPCTVTVTSAGVARDIRLPEGCFTYLRLGRGNRVSGEAPFVAGDPVALKRRRNRLPRLALSIFLDGLSGSVFRTEAFHRLMPATHAFFERGFVTLDGRSAAEWTLPSVASVSTGVRPAYHKVVHRSAFADVAPRKGSNLYFPGILQDMGFVTAQFCSNWRRSGGYGYLRGFDRSVTSYGLYPAEEVVADALEHLHVFRAAPQYLWLTFFDLHHDHGAAAEFMVRAAEGTDFVEDRTVKSVFMRRSEAKARWYLEKIRRLDLVLAGLYAHLERNFADDDMAVGLFSDHGVSFLQNEAVEQLKRLTDDRVTVPVMFRGRGLGGIPKDRLVQNYDHFPTLMSSFAPLDTLAAPGTRLDAIDLVRSDRGALVSETIYPGQAYACRVEEGGRVFQCTGGRVRRNATFDVASPELFEQTPAGWKRREPAQMPAAMRAVLAEYR